MKNFTANFEEMASIVDENYSDEVFLTQLGPISNNDALSISNALFKNSTAHALTRNENSEQQIEKHPSSERYGPHKFLGIMIDLGATGS